MASSFFVDVTSLTTGLVSKVNKLKDDIERTMDSSVSDEATIPSNNNQVPASSSSASMDDLLRSQLLLREQQLESLSIRLGELESTPDALRAKQFQLKAEGLLKEGLALADKQGKVEQALKKCRKEKDEAEMRLGEVRDKSMGEAQARAKLEEELKELRSLSKRGEESIAQIAESTAESTKRLEEARAAQGAAEKREVEMKAAMERTFAEVAEQKKLVVTLTHQLTAAKRETDHAKFQLKEQLDSRHLHGNRADSMEKGFSEAKSALEEHLKESRVLESDLRQQLARANEQFRTAEKRCEESNAKALQLTAPLLRQIDSLNENLAKNERTSSVCLTRAVTAEAAEVEAAASKKRAEASKAQLVDRMAELDATIVSLRADNSRSGSEVKLAFKRAEEAERERDALQKALDDLRTSSDARLLEARTMEIQLRQHLALEAEKFERSKRTWEESSREVTDRHQIELRRLKADVQQQQHQQVQSPAPLGNNQYAGAAAAAASDTPSVMSGSIHTAAATQDEILGNILFGDEYQGNGGAISAAMSADYSDSSPRFLLQASELQAGVRRRDARIKVLMEQLDSAVKHKEDYLLEIRKLRDRLKEIEGLEGANKILMVESVALNRQNLILLELVGEREEQIEALNSDLQDVKTTFRTQIDVLLSGSSSGSSQSS